MTEARYRFDVLSDPPSVPSRQSVLPEMNEPPQVPEELVYLFEAEMLDDHTPSVAEIQHMTSPTYLPPQNLPPATITDIQTSLQPTQNDQIQTASNNSKISPHYTYSLLMNM